MCFTFLFTFDTLKQCNRMLARRKLPVRPGVCLSKSACMPKFNFDEILQSTAEFLLLPVSENRRLPYWNSTSDLDLDLFIVIGMTNCIGVPDFIKIGQRQSYNIISIFQDCGNGAWIS